MRCTSAAGAEILIDFGPAWTTYLDIESESDTLNLRLSTWTGPCKCISSRCNPRAPNMPVCLSCPVLSALPVNQSVCPTLVGCAPPNTLVGTYLFPRCFSSATASLRARGTARSSSPNWRRWIAVLPSSRCPAPYRHSLQCLAACLAPLQRRPPQPQRATQSDTDGTAIINQRSLPIPGLPTPPCSSWLPCPVQWSPKTAHLRCTHAC